jgi:endonuclease YncB( thermonuclease family)
LVSPHQSTADLETGSASKMSHRAYASALALLVGLVTCTSAAADELAGRVVRIIDGDTLVLLVEEGAEKRQEKIRLAGIDCPERGQDFGERARQALAGYAFDREVVIDWGKRDRWDRVIGKVLVDGTDANLALVRDGLCWWYRKYAHEQSAVDQALYESAEDRARAERRGLWVDPNPVPPWEWRRR